MTQPSKPRVLIVDDNPANRLAFQTLLEPSYSVVSAEGGVEGLRLTLKDDYAVILLDVRMPGMDGFEVAEALRKRDRTRYTPVVFMSAYEKTDLQARKGYIAGATDYLFSPVDEELLKLKVATYAQMYLRNEALWRQVNELQQTVQAMQEELRRCNPSAAVQMQVRNLRIQLEELKSRLNPVPA
jgi:CheY-like chemotaxis protein